MSYSIEKENFSDVIGYIKREMAERRRLVIERNCRDLEEVWTQPPTTDIGRPPPYILLIVEEWSYLYEDARDVADAILRAAADGRALGIQVLVGAHRPETLSSFPAHIRLALKMYNEAEAIEFVCMPISVPYIAGRGVLIRARQRVPVQIAMAQEREFRLVVEQMRTALALASPVEQ
ncbi:hypothetical protein A5757_01460 [Mycobacterium sp. 852013-51886_SCH5428379]|nr:hypothetical protein A5757_01460 [Mycobacterium sp. 852013-51886_SCH5428379]